MRSVQRIPGQDDAAKHPCPRPEERDRAEDDDRTRPRDVAAVRPPEPRGAGHEAGRRGEAAERELDRRRDRDQQRHRRQIREAPAALEERERLAGDDDAECEDRDVGDGLVTLRSSASGRTPGRTRA
jgi:hypothetical protein